MAAKKPAKKAVKAAKTAVVAKKAAVAKSPAKGVVLSLIHI